MNRLITAISKNRDLVVRVVSCAPLVQHHATLQNLSPSATALLGELMSCNLMMSSGLKDEAEIQVRAVLVQTRSLAMEVKHFVV